MVVLIFTVIFALIFMARLFREKRWLSLLKAFAAVVLANLWFVGPFIQMYTTFPVEFKYQQVKSYQMSAYLSQIFNVFINPKGNAAVLGDSVKDEMGKSIGLPLIFAILALIVWYVLRKRGEKYDRSEKTALVLLLFGGLGIWMVSSFFPMRAVAEAGKIGEIINSIQFPWRLLSVISVCFAFAGAVGIDRIGTYLGNRRMLAAVLCLAIAIPCGYYIFSVQNVGDPIYREEVVAGRMTFFREYLPVGFPYVEADLEQQARMPILSNPDAVIEEYSDSNREFRMTYTGGGGTANLPMIYYPGYSAKDENGNTIELTNSPDMLLQVILPNERGTVAIRYTGLPFWTLCNIISLGYILLMIGYPLFKRLREKKNYIDT